MSREAVQNLFPAPYHLRPATEDGFYYDFAPKERPFTEEDLPAIEEEMRRIIARDERLIREVWSRDKVRDFFVKQGESFKAEWVMELPADEEISMYRSGGWMDLCRGPHLVSTGKLDPQAFKLTGVGAYCGRPEIRAADVSLTVVTGSSSSPSERSSRRRCAQSQARRRTVPFRKGSRSIFGTPPAASTSAEHICAAGSRRL